MNSNINSHKNKNFGLPNYLNQLIITIKFESTKKPFFLYKL